MKFISKLLYILLVENLSFPFLIFVKLVLKYVLKSPQQKRRKQQHAARAARVNVGILKKRLRTGSLGQRATGDVDPNGQGCVGKK